LKGVESLRVIVVPVNVPRLVEENASDCWDTAVKETTPKMLTIALFNLSFLMSYILLKVQMGFAYQADKSKQYAKQSVTTRVTEIKL
jgi:hypothetical protein